ncbi:hypothetical protein JCM11491_004827 [Sporobolomyces phaffii]
MPQVPPFLDPSPTQFARIVTTLARREQARRVLSQTSSPYSLQVGTSRRNVSNNRYGDIVAYDHTRIHFPACPEFYVNASLVVEPDLGFAPDRLPRRTWVAAQGPTGQTVPSFLSLLVEPLSSRATSTTPLGLVNVIVQLTPLVEHHREKCAPYFPSDRPGEEWYWSREDREDGGAALGGIWVRYEGRAPGAHDDGERRSWLRVGKEGDDVGRKVLHVEYLGWRDHGVPASPAHLVSFIDRINSLNASLSAAAASSPDAPSQPPTLPAPILLHCSAGVGRTGTYLAISSLLPLVSLARSDPTFATKMTSLGSSEEEEVHPLGEEYPFAAPTRGEDGVAEIDFVGWTVDRVRDQRTTMVQTREQLAFVYDALRTAYTAAAPSPAPPGGPPA